MDIMYTKDVRTLDYRAIHDFGIASLQLMKQAASRVKERLDELDAMDQHIAIVCGPGNNGGDGFALAVLLKEAGYSYVSIFCEAEEARMSQDERFYAHRAHEVGVCIMQGMDEEAMDCYFQQQDIIVDALFGTGLTRDVQGSYATCIEHMNASNAYLISIDMPSGIHSDTGVVMGKAVCADETITFVCLKPGLLLSEGSRCAQRIRVVDIGIPQAAMQDMKAIHVMNDLLGNAFLPKRRATSHKGSYGKVLLIGGSVPMHGALTLTAKSMLRSGVGTLTLFLPHDIVNILSMKIEECMLIDAPSEQGYFSMEAAALLKAYIHNYDLIVIGNGMGCHDAADELVRVVLESNLPCIIDGDGITACAKQMDLLKQRNKDCILTPHPKEMSRLSGHTVQEICDDPFSVAQEFIQSASHTTLVLKNRYTLIENKDGAYMNMAGNHALAKGGSGDVLCGIIAGLYAQGRMALQTSALGVYVHALCSDELLKTMDANSILPSDLIMVLSKIYKRLRIV